jgi:hypothetical protein
MKVASGGEAKDAGEGCEGCEEATYWMVGVCAPAAHVCGPRGDCSAESCTFLLDVGWTVHHDALRPAGGYCRDHGTDRSRGRAGWFAAPPHLGSAG